MRLFLCWWRTFWNSLGRTPPRYRGRSRRLAFEAAEARVVLSVTTTTIAPPLTPQPPAAFSNPTFAGLTGTALLNAALAKVGPALTINLPSGDYATGLASSDVADLQATVAATFVGPIPEPGFLEGYTPPMFASEATPSALIFNGADNVDNTLELDLSTLPRNEDGSLQVSTIVYNGGAGGFDTAKISGGKFKSEVYVPTGKDSGVVTYTPDDNSGPLTLIYTGLEPFIDTSYSDYYWVSTNSTSSHSINIADGDDQEGDLYDGAGNYLGQGTNHTLRIYDPSPDPAFEEVSLANKQYVYVDASDNNVNFQYTQPSGIGQLEAYVAGTATADISNLHPSASTQLNIHGWDSSEPPTIIANRETDVPSLTLQGNLIIDDSQQTEPYSYEIDNGTINGILLDEVGQLTIKGGAGSNTFNITQAPEMTLIGGNGGDTYNIDGQEGDLTIDAGAGDDTFNVTLNQFVYANIDGGGGVNSLAVSDMNPGQDYPQNYYYVSDSQVRRDGILSGILSLNYSHIASVDLGVNDGTDSVAVSASAAGPAVTVRGGSGYDTFSADTHGGDVTFVAGTGGSYFIGGTGNDVFVSGSGDDTMIGGTGNNTFVLPAASTAQPGNPPALGHDTIRANPSAASNTIDFSGFDETQPVNINIGSTSQQTISSGVLNLTLQATSGDTGIDNVVGGAGDDTIVGNARYNRLYGGEGDDTLTAGTGGSALWGGDGNDHLTGGSGTDYLYGQDGNDTLTAGSGVEKRIDGGNGDNTLTAGSGTDTIVKGHGDETIQDGSGSTTFVFQYVPGDYGLGAATITAYSGTKSGTDHLDFSNFFADNFAAPNSALPNSPDQTVSGDRVSDQDGYVGDLLHLTFTNFSGTLGHDNPGTFTSAVAGIGVSPPDDTGALGLYAYGLQGAYDSADFYLDSNGDGVLETGGSQPDQFLGTTTDFTYGASIALPYDRSIGAYTALDGDSTPVKFGSAPVGMFAAPAGAAGGGVVNQTDPILLAMNIPQGILGLPPVKMVRFPAGLDTDVGLFGTEYAAVNLGPWGDSDQKVLGTINPNPTEARDTKYAFYPAGDLNDGVGVASATESGEATASDAKSNVIAVRGTVKANLASSFSGVNGGSSANALPQINDLFGGGGPIAAQQWDAIPTNNPPFNGVVNAGLTLSWNEWAQTLGGGAGAVVHASSEGKATIRVFVDGFQEFEAVLDVFDTGNGTLTVFDPQQGQQPPIANLPAVRTEKVRFQLPIDCTGANPPVIAVEYKVEQISNCQSGTNGAQQNNIVCSAGAAGTVHYELDIPRIWL
jgi:Ca2+-binding RTX toxin-like protein